MDWFVVNVVQTLVTSGSGAGVEQAAHSTKAASLDDRKTLFMDEGDRKASMYVLLVLVHVSCIYILQY
jgi:hypothetical protein